MGMKQGNLAPQPSIGELRAGYPGVCGRVESVLLHLLGALGQACVT